MTEEVERILRCEIIFPDGLKTMFVPSGAVLEVGFSDVGEPVAPPNRVSVGAGGVTVVTGVSMRRVGGVSGRSEF